MNVQSEVERPELYLIARCGVSDEEQLMYAETKRDDRPSLSLPVRPTNERYGVYWHIEEEEVVFHDGPNDKPNSDGPKLNHFRATSLKDKRKYLQQKWQECLEQQVRIPAGKLWVYKDRKLIKKVTTTSLDMDYNSGPDDEITSIEDVCEVEDHIEMEEQSEMKQETKKLPARLKRHLEFHCCIQISLLVPGSEWKEGHVHPPGLAVWTSRALLHPQHLVFLRRTTAATGNVHPGSVDHQGTTSSPTPCFSEKNNSSKLAPLLLKTLVFRLYSSLDKSRQVYVNWL
ncbi:Hypp8387 [Branchiostoma lanceolatum]|uniref:Hypp8387 protein n=1 Tax=Branchiostoma lanceolatum TaxID=7740 RepID=A0A8J9Z863_BRALA|nr:Hypp8387 [Branchiostoma lanceolatum]